MLKSYCRCARAFALGVFLTTRSRTRLTFTTRSAVLFAFSACRFAFLRLLLGALRLNAGFRFFKLLAGVFYVLFFQNAARVAVEIDARGTGFDAVKIEERHTPVSDITALSVGQAIKVKAGNNAMDATVQEITKDGVRVQLTSGMSMIVRAEHLLF